MDGLMRELDVSNLTCGLERIHTESTVLLTQDATAENLSWVPRTPVLFSPIITWVADATDELLFRKHPRPFLRAPNLRIYIHVHLIRTIAASRSQLWALPISSEAQTSDAPQGDSSLNGGVSSTSRWRRG
ncbi:hypothetical protein BHE74_00031689 [Ensete ventricosum]|nr:hypothetical protein BHE74_00031689 [Ensete ventricosum]